MGSSLHPVTAFSRNRLIGAAFLTAVGVGILVSLATPESVSGSALPPGPPEAPPLLFSPSAPDTIPGVPLTNAQRATADSIARARADSTRRDSLRIVNLHRFVISDTTYVVDLDSTSRMRQFVYRRHDSPVVELFPDRTPPLFAANHALSYRREVSIDSTGENVRFRESVGGVDIKIPQIVSLDEYIALRRKNDLRMLIAAEARKPKQLTKTDIGDVLSNITRINIPVPANPLFSIFGKNEINLNVTGAVDIKAGFRSTKSDLTTLSILDQVRNEPDFNQEVQVNVDGTIGDKLNIHADWNTKRTFEYENQLKIKYTGYDDEIVRSVEAGNVSMTTPSSFIGSSQALFGIKAQFQFGPMTLTTLASQKKGKIQQVSVTGGAQQHAFEFRACDYATNHFWVDTTYIPYYEGYYQKEPPDISIPLVHKQILEAEVWVSRTATIADPNERQGVAHMYLDQRGVTGYSDSLRRVAGIPGIVEIGPMLKLDPTQYEIDGSGYTGVVSLNVNVTDQQIVAVAFRTLDGQWGDLTRNIPGTDTASLRIPLVLKLVKPKNLVSSGPLYETAWKQMLKNIYPIPGIGRNLK
ncbi:MAG TPA: cell surface protein SprA, partial [Bacteroidota bacterium]|nr:cell surface protein SprA [Bacteroidota bacterium]